MRSIAISSSFFCALLVVLFAGCMSDGGGPAAVTYTKDAQPIFATKCTPCHAGEGQGMHNIATTYADALKPVQSLQFDVCWGDVTTMSMPKTVGECALILARNGQMPLSFGCDRNPPPTPDLCVSKAQVDVLTAWVAGGMMQ